MFSMVMRGEVPFIRIVKDIPREMRDRLPQEFISLLETTVSAYDKSGIDGCI